MIKIITPPATLPVELEDAKRHLYVDHDDDDELITAYIKAATAHVEEFLGRALIEQTLEQYFDEFPDTGEAITLLRPPLIEVEGVFYTDENGDEHEFEDFEIDLVSAPGRIFILDGVSWPTPASRRNAVRIRYRAGYVDGSSPSVENVPFDIKAAIKLLIGSLYEQRETAVIGKSIQQIPWGVEQLLRPHVVRLSIA